MRLRKATTTGGGRKEGLRKEVRREREGLSLMEEQQSLEPDRPLAAISREKREREGQITGWNRKRQFV